jgi:hypothetical protein
MPVLHLVATATPPTTQLPQAVRLLQDAGWDVWVTATPSALQMRFLDRDAVQAATGHPVRVEQRAADDSRQPQAAPHAIAAVVTLNTLTKWAIGLNDSPAIGVLQEGLGGGLPMVAGVWAKGSLRAHPAFEQHVSVLAAAGVRFLPHGSGYNAYDWAAMCRALAA